MTRPLAIASALTLLLMATPACQVGPKSKSKSNAKMEFVALDRLAELSGDLHRFSDRFAAVISAMASDIAWSTDDRTLRERTLLIRSRAIPAIRQATDALDPRVGLAQTWIICEQIVDRLELDESREAFGEYLPMIQDVARKQLDSLNSIARDYIPPDSYESARNAIADFAARNPINPSFSLQLSAAFEREQSTQLLSVLSIPVSGLSESADSIGELARVAAVFTAMIEQMPMYARWQAELLLLELDSLESVKATSESMQRFATSAEEMTALAATLPEDVREELEVALEATGPVREDLRHTVGDLRAAIADADAAIVRAGDTIAKVSEASVQMEQTADAFTRTADAVAAVTGDIRAIQDRPAAESAGDSRPFDVTEYEAAALAIREGAVEVRGVLDDLGSGRISDAFQDADTVARESIDHASSRVEALIRSATLRLATVGGALVIVLIVGQLLIARAARR